MPDRINRESLVADFERCNDKNPKWTPQRVKTLILRQPTATVDAVPVVRCRDCQFCCTGIMGPWCSLADGMLVISPDAFCSYGVRREGTDD